MSENVEHTTLDQLTLFVGDSLARISAMPESVQGLQGKKVDSGQSLPESFASYDPDTQSWRTSQLCLFGGWEPFLETWPRVGMMLSGECYELPILARLTDVKEYSYLLTPIAMDGRLSQSLPDGYKRKNNHPYGSLSEQLITKYGLRITPNFQEQMMGFPIGWTDLNPVETP